MAVPTLLTTSPNDGDTDVAVNSTIKFTFDTALLRSSVNEATVLLYRDDTGEHIARAVRLSTSGTVITVTPSKTLAEDVTYVAAVVGSASNMAGGNIKAADATDFITTRQVTFRTKIERYVSLPEVTSRTDYEEIGPIREGDTGTDVSGYLAVEETSPAGFASDVDRNLSEIAVTFDQTVLPTGSHAAFELTIENVLGIDEYYGEQGDDGTDGCRMDNRFLKDWLKSTDDDCIDLFGVDPSGNVTVSGSTATWTRDTNGPAFHYNSEVVVRVRADSLVSPTGHMLEEDVYFFFTTEYFPMYTGVNFIRLKLGRTVSDLYDDTIRRHILAASIDAVDQAAGKFDVEHPYPAVRRYVSASVILAILDEMGVLTALNAGSKSLGDLRIEYSPNDLSKLASIARRAENDKEKALFELRAYRRQSIPQYVVRGIDNPFEREDYFMRTWQHLRNTGQSYANSEDIRRAKSELAKDHPSIGTSVTYVGRVSEQQVQGITFPWWID